MRRYTRCLEIQKYAQRIANDETSYLPILSYMSISRVNLTKRSDYGKAIKNLLNDRRCGYIGCMDSVIDKTSILDWIKKMSYESVLNEKSMPELVLFHEIISSIMQNVSALPEKPQIRYSADLGDLAYIENDIMRSVHLLSSGYQSLLWMAMDFAFRLALLNPELKTPEDATGIILIDEIDMHLHPKWQWNILNAFRKTLPNVQFIVATHAPIILASCENCNLIQLKDFGQVRYLDSAFAYSVNSVLELRQGTYGILRELKEKISTFDHLLNEGKTDEAREVLSKMEQQFGYYNTDVIEARTELELETVLSEKE